MLTTRASTAAALALVVVTVAYAAALEWLAQHAHDAPTTTEPKMPMHALSGYDLQSAVSAIMEAVDGCEPAPVVVTATAAVPSTLELVSDKRAQAAAIVGLTVTGLTALEWRATPSVQGISLVEGVMPVDAIVGSTTSEDGLLVPIIVPAQAPLRIEIGALPGESPAADTAIATAQFLYGSDAAVRAVARAFGGQGGWYSLYAQRGAASRTVSLTTQRAGNPRYLRSDQSGGVTLDLALDGRRMTVPAVTIGAVQPGAALVHSVTASQVYQGTFALTDAVNGRGFWTWHGVRDALP